METSGTTTTGRTWMGESQKTLYGSVVGAGLLLIQQAGMLRPSERWGAASRQYWPRNGGGFLTGVGTPRYPLSDVILTNMLGVRRAREIRPWITRRMDLWERGMHAGLVEDAKAERAAQEGRAASGGEEEDNAIARSYHDKVFSGKIQ